MKTYSYPRLLLATTSVLGCIFAFIAWRSVIDHSTFLTRQTLHMLLVADLILSSAFYWGVKKWGKAQQIQGILDNLKIWVGAVLIVALCSYLLVSTAVWLIPGRISTYSAAYVFSAGSRNNCSGAYVDDPDLKRRIKVCEPVGNYFSNGTLNVIKRTNALGMTIVSAETAY